jgi:hypothetical protein
MRLDLVNILLSLLGWFVEIIRTLPSEKSTLFIIFNSLVSDTLKRLARLLLTLY